MVPNCKNYQAYHLFYLANANYLTHLLYFELNNMWPKIYFHSISNINQL